MSLLSALRNWWQKMVVKVTRNVQPPVVPPPSPTPPSAPVVGTPSVVGSTATIPLTTASTGPNGVVSYNARIGTTPGGEGVTPVNFAVWPYHTTLGADTYYMTFTGLAPTGLESLPSNEVSFTIAGALGPDTTKPLTPTIPVLESGGATVLPTVVRVTPSADDTTNSGTQAVTGSLFGRWTLNGVYQAGWDSYLPSVGTRVLTDIGNKIVGSGTDTGTVITGCGVQPGVEAHYSTQDGGYTLNAAPARGKIITTVHVTALSSPGGGLYDKPFGLDRRASLAAYDAYVAFLLFNPLGVSVARVEARLQPGAAAAAVSADVAFTLPCDMRFSYDPDTTLCDAAISQDSGAHWTTVLSNFPAPALGNQYLAGRFSCNGGSGTYSSYLDTLDPYVRFSWTGTRQIGAVTSFIVGYQQCDAANPTNVSTMSPLLTVNYDALPNGGGGGGSHSWGGGYYIGGSSMNHNTPRAVRLYAQEHRTIMSAENNWEATFATTMQTVWGQITAKNPDWRGSQYLDTTRTQTSGFYGAVFAFSTYQPYGAGWCLLNGDGTIAYWNDNFGRDVVENMAATALDGQGRSIGRFDAQYRWDAFRNGGRAGLSSIGMSPNSYCVSTYIDDLFGAFWIQGLFTVGNVGAAAAIQNGYKSIVSEQRSIFQQDGVTFLSAANLSQGLQNMQPDAIAAYNQVFDIGLYENIGSAIGSTWGGPNGLIALWQANQQTLITSNGFGIFQYLCSPTADAAELRRRRVTMCFARIFSNHLYNPQYDAITYYVPADQQPVRMQYYDVNPSTGVGNPLPYDSDYLMLAWTGDPVAGAAGAIQTTPYSGSYVYRRQMATAIYAACAPEAPGPQTFTFPVRVRAPSCADDSTFNGASYNAGVNITLNPGDGMVYQIY